MYIPPSFVESDLSTLHDFIESHSFATMISQHAGEPFASHVPLLLDRAAGPNGRLIGHFARSNPHWQSIAEQTVLTIFHGPHAYISPDWMAARNTVPTWNYVAVHAYGRVRLIEDRKQLAGLLRRMVETYETPRATPWSVDTPESEFIDKLLGAIVGFEIDIERLEGKWKLNQNHPVERRERIIAGLQNTDRPDEMAIAELIRATIPVAAQ